MTKKNKLRLFFYSNSALFVGGSANILFAQGPLATLLIAVD